MFVFATHCLRKTSSSILWLSHALFCSPLPCYRSLLIYHNLTHGGRGNFSMRRHEEKTEYLAIENSHGTPFKGRNSAMSQ